MQKKQELDRVFLTLLHTKVRNDSGVEKGERKE